MIRKTRSLIFISLIIYVSFSCNIGVSVDGTNKPNSPQIPATVNLTRLSDSQIDLSWEAFENTQVVSYRIYRDDRSIGETPDLIFSDSGLAAVSQYRFTIVGLDEAGNELEQSQEFYGSTSNIYYIDPVDGNDMNDGTSVDQAWKSFRNITSYWAMYDDQWPDLARRLKPADIVYVLDGTISELTSSGDDHAGPNIGGRQAIFYLRSFHGTQSSPLRILAYPGHNPRFDPNYQGEGLVIKQSSWIVFQGIDITRSYTEREGGNIRLDDVDHFILKDCEVSNADGIDNYNVAGFSCVSSSNLEIANCTFFDNYDRSAADTGGITTPNSTNMVFFGGRDITVHDCLIYQSQEIGEDINSGAGIKYKHSTPFPNGYFHVYNNIFRNCKFFAIETGSANSHIHHNIIIGGNHAIVSKDCGGPTHQVNQIFEYNTIYNPRHLRNVELSENAFSYHPTIRWRNDDFPNDPQNIQFRRNLVVQSGRYSLEHSVINMYPYINNELYNYAIPEFFVDENAYFNTAGEELMFSVAAADSWGTLGGNHTLMEWKGLGWLDPATGITEPLNYDQNSVFEDPQLISIDENLEKYEPQSSAFRPASDSPATAMGAYAGR